MKKVQINLNTIIFVSDTLLTVMGAYNSHSNLLVYNAPMLSSQEVSMMLIECEAISPVPESIGRFESDLFGIDFYNPESGSFSKFHEIVFSKVVKKSISILESNPDGEFPLIGTFPDVENTSEGREIFKVRLAKALEEHFVEYVEMGAVIDTFGVDEALNLLFSNRIPNEVGITIKNVLNGKIHLMETWIY